MDNDKNLNINYDKNFDEIVELCDKNLSHQELLDMLKSGTIAQKQIAALRFDSINDVNDTCALLANLTGCDGKIREAVALTINKFISTDNIAKDLFAKNSADIFSNATIDINGNICRLIVNASEKLIGYEKFRNVYIKNIMKLAYDALDELDKFIFRDKKYTINKQLFKLYWCLEAISKFTDYIENETLYALLKRTVTQDEYTIREKTAEILNKTEEFYDLKEILSSDKNYYVRRVLN